MLKWIFAKFRGIFVRLNTLPAGIKVGLIVVVLAVASVGAYGGGRFYDYSQNDPNFCQTCHTMQKAWNLWNTSEHQTVNCHNCHEPDVIENMQQVIVFAAERPDEPGKKAVVPDKNCKKCHESGDPNYKQVANTPGHKVHNQDQGIACTTCHGGISLHRFKPPQDLCTTCHQDKTIKVGQMAGQACQNCHKFLQTSDSLKPTRDTCLSCHKTLTQNNVTFPDDAPMKFTCSDCHKPHESDKPTVNCLSCHSNVKNEGLHKAATHSITACQTCHKPHQWVVTSRDVCEACHSNKKDHNTGFVCKDCHDFKKAS